MRVKKILYFGYNSSRNLKKIVIKVVKGDSFKYNNNEGEQKEVKSKMKQYTILNKSCLDAMDEMEENSIDCIITDPPYEINFMSKKWDNTGIAFDVNTWKKSI